MAATAPASLVTALINDVAATTGPFILVLDDYHTITELAIHEAMGFLLERQPPNMHLLIATRQDPPLPLSRLRGRGQLTEIRQSHLRFSPEQTVTFLNECLRLDLDASDIATLDERTEGWVAGLQMAGLSMQGRDAQGTAQFIAGFSARYHCILDYLTDEVLERQPGPVQTFLLQTSILKRMCGPLCDAVTGWNPREPAPAIPPAPIADAGPPWSSRSVLLHLEQSNLFLVPLDNERKWYCYHHLFGELLRARLQETEPDQAFELHRRAAKWYEQDGLTSEAVHHALETRDYPLATEMIERALIKLSTWSSLDVATLRGWLHALPEEAMRKKPWLQLFSSRVHHVAGQWESAKRVLDELEESLRTDPSTPDAERMLGLVAADRAGYATVRGELRQAARFAQQALARLPEDNPIAQMRMTATLGMAHMRTGEVAAASRAFTQAIDLALAADMHLAAMLFICNLAEAQFVQGKLRQAIETCERALRLGTVDDEHITGVGFAWLELGRLFHQQNDLEAAERHLLTSQELLGRAGIAKSFGSGLALMAQVRQAQGDDKGAQAAIEQAMQMAQQDSIPRLSILVSAYQARIWLAQGQLGSAAGWARDYAQVGETEYLREFEDLTLARVLLAEGKPQAALSLLDTLLAPAEAAGRIGSVIEAQALRALALHALNAVSEAMEALRPALELAEPEGHIRIFVDSGAPMAALLRRAASLGITPGHVRKLIAAGGFPKPWSSKPAHPHPQPLIEPPSGREMEVLNLLAEGFSNREIAQRLVISLPTVKSHTRSIYAKLDVHSREQPVASTRTLGILPPE